MATSLALPTWPRSLPVSDTYTVQLDGRAVRPLRTSAGEFVACSFTGELVVEVRATRAIAAATVRPLQRGVAVTIVGGSVRFSLARPGYYYVEIDGLPALYLFAEAPEAGAPKPSDPGVRWFASGQIHEVGLLDLGPGDTLYVQAGAVVRGAIRATRAHGARVLGRGIIDNSYFPRGNPDGTRRPFLATYSDDVRVEGPIFIEPATWTVHFAACSGVRVRGVKILGSLLAADGVDLSGVSDAVVEDCFIRSDDDCVAVKSCEYSPHGKDPGLCRDVAGVRVERCVLHSYGGGSAVEIGHELRCREVRDIAWRDLDILAVHDYGAALSIKNCDHALVRDVLYEDIRIEHFWYALIDFRIMRSRYAVTPDRGRIRDVTLRRISAIESIYNPGYTISHLGGWDADHGIDTVRFEACTYGGRPIRSLDDFDCYAKHARGITFG
jgi:hypothetical protein